MTKIIFLLLILCSEEFLFTAGLRFDPDPVSAEGGVLSVNRPTKLTCNYVKFKTESVREINWYAGYNGIRTKIFHYLVTSGTKEGIPFSFIKTDESSATPTTLVITLPEFRSPFLTLGCEVEVLRDSGYGKLKTAKKLEESNITVIDSNRHQLILRSGTETFSTLHSATEPQAVIGDPLVVSCMSAGSDLSPRLLLNLNDQPWEQNFPGQIKENPLDQGIMFNGQRATASITGRLSQVTEEMFQYVRGSPNKVLVVECLAQFQDQIFDRKELTFKRIERSAVGSNPYLQGASAISSNPYNREPQGAETTNPYLRDPNVEDPDQYLSPEISRGERRPHYDSSQRGSMAGTSGSSFGFNRNDRQGKVYDHEEIHSRLLELVDPARHNHPGIPYDFYSGYILMISDHVEGTESTSSYGPVPTSTTTLLGKLPDYVVSAFQVNYGRYNMISNEKYRVKMDPVEVLNILGGFGYRVIDSTMTQAGKMIWTIEHRKFEVESAQGHLRGRDL